MTQENFPSPSPLYEVLEFGKTNMVCMVLSTLGQRPFVSGTLASKDQGVVNRNAQWHYLSDICTLSVYPHHYNLEFLGALLHMLGTWKQGFHYLVSSHSMLTFVAHESQVAGIIHLLSTGFDLPKSHAPFEQEENDELALFIKKKYPETRATYVEERIKTYGMALVKDVYLEGYEFSFEDLSRFGKKLKEQGKGERFFHITAYMTPDQRIYLYPVTGKPHDNPGGMLCSAEVLSFYGPHFGDRYGIMGRALKCLSQHDIPVIQAGCTGASICIVLPRAGGEAAEQALKDVFENP